MLSRKLKSREHVWPHENSSPIEGGVHLCVLIWLQSCFRSFLNIYWNTKCTDLKIKGAGLEFWVSHNSHSPWIWWIMRSPLAAVLDHCLVKAHRKFSGAHFNCSNSYKCCGWRSYRPYQRCTLAPLILPTARKYNELNNYQYSKSCICIIFSTTPYLFNYLKIHNWREYVFIHKRTIIWAFDQL